MNNILINLAFATLISGAWISTYVSNPKHNRFPEIKSTLNESGSVRILDTQGLKQSLNRMAPYTYVRETGNTLRAWCGQDVEWIIQGDRNPGMIFTNIDMWVVDRKSAAQWATIDRSLDKIASITRRLNDEGWQVVILPVPPKIAIHDDLCRWPVTVGNLYSQENRVESSRAGEFFDHLHAGLDARRVPNVRLFDAYRRYRAKNPESLLYATNDSHWSGRGILIAAESVAQKMSSEFGIKSAPPVTPVWTKVDHIGDMVTPYDMLGDFVPRLSSVYHFTDYLCEADAKRGYPYPSNSDDLVVCVGTSFSGQYTWVVGKPVGFAWQVQLHLDNTEVQNKAYAGRGSFYPMKKFIDEKSSILSDFEKTGQKKPPRRKVVIWEFPVRDLPNVLND